MPSLFPPDSSGLWPPPTPHPGFSRAAENQCWPRKLPPQPAFCQSPYCFPCANHSRAGDLLAPRVCMGNRGGSCGTQRAKHSNNHSSALLRAGALAQPTSGHPGVPWKRCDILPGGDSLRSPGIATGAGQTRLASRAGQFPAKMATLPGAARSTWGPLAGQVSPCHS